MKYVFTICRKALIIFFLFCNVYILVSKNVTNISILNLSLLLKTFRLYQHVFEVQLQSGMPLKISVRYLKKKMYTVLNVRNLGFLFV